MPDRDDRVFIFARPVVRLWLDSRPAWSYHSAAFRGRFFWATFRLVVMEIRNENV